MDPAPAESCYTAAMRDTLGLYVHVPFCRRKCHYCDFACYAGQEAKIDAYLEALERELASYPEGLSAQTLYLGGGTPSLLAPEQLTRLVEAVTRRFRLAADAERTMEINPGQLHGDLPRIALELGFDRLSLGAQSFDDALLARLGRDHRAADTRRTFAALREAGCQNLSLDLMYGLPDQTMIQWEATLEEALELGPEHFSVYGLILEERTAFGAWHRQGKLELPGEELEVAMGDRLAARLEAAGYQRYEISSWARPGRESRHNLRYWRLEPTLGLGAGAHSFWQDRRYARPRGLAAYMTQPEAPFSAAPPASDRELQEEMAFLALRMTQEGLAKAAFRARWNQDVEDVFPGVLERLLELELVVDQGDRYLLTPRGIWLSNEVFAAFLA